MPVDTQLDQKDTQLRVMQSEDLQRVLMIERQAQVMPWSRLSFEESLSKQHLCRVLELPGKDSVVAGFHVICPIADEMHILNLVVAPEFQSQGLAHLLLHDIVDLCQQQKCRRLFLEVRASNQVALSLYQKWQFQQLTVRKNYYRCPERQREDAIAMLRQIDPLKVDA